MKLSHNSRLIYILFTCLIFICLFLFFVNITPMIPFDTDDWIFVSIRRLPIPLWRDREPTRVWPLTIMPICGYLVKFIAYPILHNYLLSYVYVSAGLLAGLVTLLGNVTNTFFKNRFSISFKKSLAYEAIFLSMFFIIFRNRGTSRCMFTADNFSCIFFYTCSGLLNAISIISIIRYSDFCSEFKSFSVPKKILWSIFYYFTIFSNVWHSCGLGIFAGVIIITYWIQNVKNNNKSIIAFLKKHYYLFLIELLWGTCLVFEFFGGRASTVSEGVAISIKASIKTILGMTTRWSIPYKIIFILSIIWLLYFITKVRSKNNMIILIIGIAACTLTTIYLILLGGIVPYLSRIEAGWMLWFWTILFVMWSIISFVEYINLRIGYYWIIATVCIILSILPNGRYLRSCEIDDYELCTQIVQNVIDQVVTVSEQNCTEATVITPGSTNPNRAWYFGDSYGYLIEKALYKHGVIKNDVNIISEIDYSLFDSLFE